MDIINCTANNSINSITVRGNTPQSDRRLRVTSTNAATNRTRVTSTTKTICGVMNDMSMDAKSVAEGPHKRECNTRTADVDPTSAQ